MVSDPREMCSPHGIPRPSVSDHPRPLVCEVRHVVEPRSNVVDLRSRRVVLQCPGSPLWDWAADPELGSVMQNRAHERPG